MFRAALIETDILSATLDQSCAIQIMKAAHRDNTCVMAVNRNECPALLVYRRCNPTGRQDTPLVEGHFVVNVPYDLYQPMIFQGEEMSIGIRGFTVGYDMYAPERSVCFHHYAVGKNAKLRNKVPHFWENGDKYAGIGRKAMQRLLGIVHMNPEIPTTAWDHVEEDRYGLGGVRTPEKFYETFGIDVVHKTTEHNLCEFVDKGRMHRDFQKLLRDDGMGVDYGKITYRFKDPHPASAEY
ncbi:glycosyltransferase [Fragilaria crotonensis]|nr:glycosyltransferase [Fragilaria crotonensis]